MRVFPKSATVIAGLALLGAVPLAIAAPVDAFTDNGSHGSNNGTGLALASDLTVTSATGITVQSLGFYDQGLDGLFFAHNVNLYDISGATPTLLDSETVPAGTTATLDNGFRYVTLHTPIFVPTGNKIAVVAYQLDGNSLVPATTGQDPYDDGTTAGGGSSFNGAPGLTYAGNSYDFNNETSGVPCCGSNNPDTFGAGSLQFSVGNATPEPASLSLLSLGALSLLARRRTI